MTHAVPDLINQAFPEAAVRSLDTPSVPLKDEGGVCWYLEGYNLTLRITWDPQDEYEYVEAVCEMVYGRVSDPRDRPNVWRAQLNRPLLVHLFDKQWRSQLILWLNEAIHMKQNRMTRGTS